jgi:hypothetical protein
VAVLLVLSGLSVLAGAARPGSLAAALPRSLVVVWAVTVLAGGMLVLLAAVWRARANPLVPLYLELVADLPLALMCATYATAAWAAGGSRAVVSAGIITAAAVAFAVRFVQVYRSLTQLRRELADMEGGTP